MNYIILPIIFLGSLAIIYGLVLAFASKKFYVEVNPKIEQIAEILPNANCGACGYPGCAGYAEAIVNENAPISKCPPSSEETIKKIAEIMGIKAQKVEKSIAVILCKSGGKNNTNFKYKYQGISSCKSMNNLCQGNNECAFGCLGENDCVKACPFDAIILDENNNRIIDKEKCTGCGACAIACPRNLIKIVPLKKEVHILCSSKDKGAIAKKSCGANSACIGCGICAKKCPVSAIKIENNLAVIDYEKCISCGFCAKNCPTKAIVDLKEKRGKVVIDEEKCIGCTICKKQCPVSAIEGELKKVHKIDYDKCVSCELCKDKCPKKAIHIEY